MANTTSSKLYDLIYSMTSSERRYFKLDISKQIGKENKLCLRLFDLITKSEGKPIEKTEEKITFTDHPSRLKNYLYESILRSMDSYHANTSVKLKIRRQINHIEHLYDRALYKECLVLIRRALKDVEKTDYQSYKILLLHLYSEVVIASGKNNMAEVIAEIDRKQLEAVDKLKREKEYLSLSHRTYAYIRKNQHMRPEGVQEELKKLSEDSLMQDYSLAETFYSKLYFNNIKAMYNSYIGNKIDANLFYEKMVKLYDGYPEIKKMKMHRYIGLLNNYAQNSCQIGEYKKGLSIFSKMEDIKSNERPVEIQIFQCIAANKIGIYLDLLDFDKALKELPYIEKGMGKYGEKIDNIFKLVVYTNLCYLFFVIGDYKKALLYNNLIFNAEQPNYRSDLYRIARIMRLIIHYELGDIESIPYFFASTQRYIKKQTKIYNFEKWFIRFFKGLLKVKNSEKKMFLSAEEKKLLLIGRDEEERKLIMDSNILGWMRINLDNISYKEANREYVSCDSYEDYIKLRI